VFTVHLALGLLYQLHESFIFLLLQATVHSRLFLLSSCIVYFELDENSGLLTSFLSAKHIYPIDLFTAFAVKW